MDGQSESYPKPVVGSNPYLRGGVRLANGAMAAFFDNTVALCEPYVPYAWPPEYQFTTEHPIVGLGAFGQSLVVCTTGKPYLSQGADSASMTPLQLEDAQACLSARTIMGVAGGVLYVSPDGLCMVSASGVQVVTSALYSREDWLALNPAAMFAAWHDGTYYLFHSSGTITFQPAGLKLGRLALVATAAYVDRLLDALYVASGTSIMAVFGGATRRTSTWRSGRVVMPAHTGFGWLQVLGDQTPDAPVMVRWYADGVLTHTATVTDTQPQRLPAGRWLEHEFEVESAARVTRVTMAGSTAELQQA